MLNAKSMAVTFRQWCEDNGFTAMLSKFLDNKGKVKTQYIGPDNSLEHEYIEAIALRKWTVVDNDNLVINKKVKISDNGWQWSSPIIIMHSTVTITKLDDNDA
eukprot:2785404-Amphidinium_carterae.2